jgi:hypothetical protein
MPVTIKAIREQLEAMGPQHVSSNNAEIQIDTVAPLQSQTDYTAPNTLYVGWYPSCRRTARPTSLSSRTRPCRSTIKRRCSST